MSFEESIELFAKSVIALTDVESMKVANLVRESYGESPAYTEQDFLDISKEIHSIVEGK